jgi:5'(3')-deoxyribonucleotidase
METRIFFDLDGVLADMDGGLKKNPEIIQLRSDLDNLIETKFQDYKGLVDDDIKTKFKAELEKDPNSPVKELKKSFNKYTSKVFSIAAKPGFYRNLPLMPGAKEMVAKAAELTGKLPNILSAPVGDENDLNNPSVIEKKDWVKEHFDGMVDQVIITIDKGKAAEGKTDILIDDRPKYVEKFTSAGGTAILHTDYKKTLLELEGIIKSMSTTESKKWIKTFESFRKNKK